MYPLIHILASLIFILALKFLTSFTAAQLAVIFLSAMLIDVDHWLVYVRNVLISEHPKNLKGFFDVIKKRNFSIIKSYKWFADMDKVNKTTDFLYVFHTIEIFIALILLSLKYQIFQLVLTGMSFHMIIDIIDVLIKKKDFKKPSIILELLGISKKR